MSHAISALLFLDSKGKPVLARDYRCELLMAVHALLRGFPQRIICDCALLKNTDLHMQGRYSSKSL